jgi:hypothetical protein
MKYTVEITMNGSITVEANSEDEALEIADDGFELNDFHCYDYEVGEVSHDT